MRAIGAALTARGVAPERVATEAFGAVAVHASGIVKAGDRAPHAPDGPPGTGPTVTFVAQQPRRRRGTTATRACSTSPRRATCRSASAAASASATTARAAWSPARSPTTPTRSSRRPRAGSWSAAATLRRSSRWTYDARGLPRDTVTISNGRNGTTISLRLDLSRREAVLQEVGEPRVGEGDPDAQAADAAGAVGLVEADDEVVAVLGSLDGVDHEAGGVRGQPRVTLAIRLAEQQRGVGAQSLCGDAAVLPAAAMVTNVSADHLGLEGTTPSTSWPR